MAVAGGGGSTPGDTSQALRSAAQALAVSVVPPVFDLALLPLDNPTPGCPTITVQGNQIVMSFGSGCTNDAIGYAAGTVSVETISQNQVRMTFSNFAWEVNDSLPINGQLTVNASTLTAQGELQYGSGSCRPRFTITQATGDGASYSIQGTVTTNRGSFPYTASVSFGGNCDWATGGNIVIGNGAARIDYLPNCGTAQFTINGQTETVNLNNLANSYNPCN